MTDHATVTGADLSLPEADLDRLAVALSSPTLPAAHARLSYAAMLDRLAPVVAEMVAAAHPALTGHERSTNDTCRTCGVGFPCPTRIRHEDCVPSLTAYADLLDAEVRGNLVGMHTVVTVIREALAAEAVVEETGTEVKQRVLAALESLGGPMARGL